MRNVLNYLESHAALFAAISSIVTVLGILVGIWFQYLRLKKIPNQQEGGPKRPEDSKLLRSRKIPLLFSIAIGVALLIGIGTYIAFSVQQRSPASSANQKEDAPSTTNRANNNTELSNSDYDTVKKNGVDSLTAAKGIETIYDLGNGVKLEMIRIPAKGKTFMMGSPKNESGRGDDEEQHEVTFKHSWDIGKYEVTQEQYQAILGKNPAHYIGPKNPVERVSWEDVQVFLARINDKFRDREMLFRLPSEAEWEYSCRAGTTTPFHFGNELDGKNANCDASKLKGIEVQGQPLRKTCRVGMFSPNSFGLYDMHGNVRELCDDWYGPYKNAPNDGTAQNNRQTADVRMMRGGSWYDSAQNCRSSTRHSYTPDNGGVGFRLAATLK
ncbi:MAG: formylglycine-generating enzyme family protein [Planctomycetes bacterium]|nr:formylglycine-generating enzyme family protein [Planctomycetota bacterium]